MLASQPGRLNQRPSLKVIAQSVAWLLLCVCVYCVCLPFVVYSFQSTVYSLESIDYSTRPAFFLPNAPDDWINTVNVCTCCY